MAERGERRVIGGRYEIQGIIGQGGMGAVYKGVDRQSGETVAIKSLKAEILALDPGMVERFQREGEALRRLNHPNIVKMLATIHDGSEHFIVMEYVGGGSLRDLLDETPQLPVEHVLNIALDLSDALTRAHRLKIIHRDIKPANVLLAEDGTPRLTDFGVARTADSTMTQSGSMLGTPAYLSPESASGTPANPRSDIWAFGVMLYEMLAGRRPYEEANTMALLTAILTKPVPDVREFRPDTPPRLAALIHEMLEKDETQRIASVRQIGARLEAIISGEATPLPAPDSTDDSHADWTEPDEPTLTPTSAVASRPATPLATMHTTGTKRPVQVVQSDEGKQYLLMSRRFSFFLRAMIILVVLSAVGVLVLTLSSRGGTPGATPTLSAAATAIPTVAPVQAGQYMVLVAQPEQVGGAKRDVQRFIVDDLTQHLTNDVSFSNLQVRAYPGIIQSNDEAIAVAEANKAAVILWGTYDDSGTQLEVQVGDLGLFKYNPFSRADMEKITNVRAKITDEHNQTAAFAVFGVFQTLLSADGDMYGVSNNTAIANAVTATNLAEVVGGSPAARFNRMVTLFQTGRIEESLKAINDAISQNANIPLFYTARSLIEQRLGQFDAALEDARTSQKMGPEKWAAPILQLGNDALLVRSDLDSAINYYTQIIALRPDDAGAYSNRAVTYYLQGKYDQSRDDAERAIALNFNGNIPYFFAIAIALHQGRLADAQSTLKTVFVKFPDPSFVQRLMEVTIGTNAPNNFFIPFAAAFGNLTLRQWSKVIEDSKAAVAANPSLSDAYYMQGFAYCNLKDYPNAEAAYTKGLAIDPKFYALYALRAEARLKQGNLLGATADVSQLLQGDQAAAYRPLMPLVQSGKLSCENLLDVDMNALLGTTTAPAENATAEATP